ncbi:NTP transferase domain-containing protein [Diaminobutyricibacter tongyongensis]|uniref:Molybdopterin molybdenumtransferase n=1 Tax=Leifsonia tongyongensis TaxID=1268043 RepID=A0A6L9XT51_9MICO|nr:NTP transferase domain-containing protein [Diaminobutyricibacter tongyongensis]NEN04590.1 NTP transferase domain-containing protein [Diaminobutyricibacter tongyongensis]
MPTFTTADVDAIILAGGRAVRLGGRDKGALVYEGRTLIERALAAAASASHRVVVGDPATAAVPSGVRVVREEPMFSGPASAVMAGVDALAEAGSTATWVFVLACDVVRSAELTGALLAGAERHPDADGVVPIDQESRRQLLVGLYRVSALRASRDGIGDVANISMKRLLEPLSLVELPDDGYASADVDTPEQAQALGIELPATAPATASVTAPAQAPSIADARLLAHELGAARPASVHRAGLAAAAGLTLADDVTSPSPVPAFANSAMDGWAVAGNWPWRLGEPIHAGDDVRHRSLEPGCASPIMTGAEVPAGTWAVVRSEDGVVAPVGTGAGEWELSLRPGLGDPREGHHIRPAGEEAAVGEVVLHRGEVLTPPRLGFAAACGCDDLPVRVPPTVDLVVVGDELVASGASGAGRIRDALTPQLVPLIEGAGARSGSVGQVRDQTADIRAAIERSAGDLIIVTGGTSIGTADHTRGVLESMGVRVVIDGIAMRPGRPALVAVLQRGTVAICLPGNPLAAMLAALVLLGPMVEGMLGRPLTRLPLIRLAADIPNPRQGSLLVPCAFGPDGRAKPTGWADSGMVRGLALADTVAILPQGGASQEDRLPALPLAWSRP